MARRHFDANATTRSPPIDTTERETTVASFTSTPDVPPVDVLPEPTASTEIDEVPAGDAPTSAPTLTVEPEVTPPDLVGLVSEVPPTEPPPVERFRVETSVYYVPTLGFGAVFVPAGTTVTRVSHDLQKLIAQGAKLRPID